MSVVHSGDVEFVDLSTISPEPRALRKIPRALALRHDALSLSGDDNQLTVALPENAAPETVDRIRLATGMHVRTVPAKRDQIRERLREAYPGDDDGDAAAIRRLDAIHRHATAVRSSDIHFETLNGGGRIRIRIDGTLQIAGEVAQPLFTQILSRVKLLAGMDIGERRHAQDGRYTFDGDHGAVDARVSVLPSLHGEKIVLRLLHHGLHVPAVADLGMFPAQEQILESAMREREGLIVVAGPTGCGKTTTLYAALSKRDPNRENICTVEDPVEIALPGATQVQVHERAGITFGHALRALLRQDPDVLMLGETRDAETAQIIGRAALTGQLVLTTLHAVDAIGVIDRLLELGIASRTLASSLKLIVSQRLVRKVCRSCTAGCAGCGGTGFAGRTAVFEILQVAPPLRRLIARGARAAELRTAALDSGFVPMAHGGTQLVASAVTTYDELIRVLPAS